MKRQLLASLLKWISRENFIFTKWGVNLLCLNYAKKEALSLTQFLSECVMCRALGKNVELTLFSLGTRWHFLYTRKTCNHFKTLIIQLVVHFDGFLDTKMLNVKMVENIMVFCRDIYVQNKHSLLILIKLLYKYPLTYTFICEVTWTIIPPWHSQSTVLSSISIWLYRPPEPVQCCFLCDIRFIY